MQPLPEGLGPLAWPTFGTVLPPAAATKAGPPSDAGPLSDSAFHQLWPGLAGGHSLSLKQMVVFGQN